MRTATGLDTHDAFRRKSFRARENELVLFGVNVVRNHVNVIGIAKPVVPGQPREQIAVGILFICRRELLSLMTVGPRETPRRL